MAKRHHKGGKKHHKVGKKHGGKTKIVPAHLMGKSLHGKHGKKAHRKMSRKHTK